MSVQHFPVVQVSGSAYERGRQHGARAQERVARSMEIYRNAFASGAGMSWPQVIERATGFARAIEALDADILAEMQGIGDGAGYQLEEVVAINCRTEILFGNRAGKKVDSEAHECTTIAVAPRASATGSTLVGKNWDWKAACLESVIVLQAEQDNAPDFVMVVEAGMVGRDGFNSAGVAVCGNLLRSIKDGGKPGAPVPIIRRRVLNSPRFDHAMAAVMDADRSASTNYLLAHESGLIVNFEASPEQVYPVYPEQGLLTHSNHFTSIAAQVQGIGGVTSPDTLYRNQRARDLLEPKIGHITVEDIQHALSDHAGYPQSICRHLSDDADSLSSMSIASIVMDLGERVMYVSSGNPCSNAYQAVRLPGQAKEGAVDARHASVAAG